MTDKALGAIMLLVASVVFVYYTAWALVTVSTQTISLTQHSQPNMSLFQPFFPADHPLQELFPTREWAVRVPAFILVCGISAVGAFFGRVMMKEARKQREKKTARLA